MGRCACSYVVALLPYTREILSSIPCTLTTQSTETRGLGTHEERRDDPSRARAGSPALGPADGGRDPAKQAEAAEHHPPESSPLLTAISALAPPHQQPPVFARKLDHVTHSSPGSAERNQTSRRLRLSREGGRLECLVTPTPCEAPPYSLETSPHLQ